MAGLPVSPSATSSAGPSARLSARETGEPAGPSAGLADELAALTAAVDRLANRDLTGLPDPVAAEQVLRLRRLVDRLEGHWLKELAGVDARGAAGADQGVQAPSTAGWLRSRLRMGHGAAGSVRTARALYHGPLPHTGQALTDGAISPAHAGVLAAGTHDLPTPTTVAAEPVLVEAARRLAGAGAVTRVLVSRQPTGPHRHPGDHHPGHRQPTGPHGHPGHPDHHDHGDGHPDPHGDPGLTRRPPGRPGPAPPLLGGPPASPSPRAAPPGSAAHPPHRPGRPRRRRPLSPPATGPGLVPGHQLVHRADGRPTDLANLLSGAAQQHRAVHDGGWQLHRGPDGHLDARPPKRPHRRRPAGA